ncbi:MAG TPA: rhomboid family intramembrane serine protease [Jatrophihabitantaceae bacterium]|nr:rhomboid family intramembrane serine protease [Jatrophihabitantaceae bacterium]
MRPASVGFHCPDDVKLAQRSVRAPRTTVGAPLRAGVPYVTWSLIGLNVLAYLATVRSSADGINNPTEGKLFSQWFLEPYVVAHDDGYYRLITSAFEHESLLHIGLNMFALYIVGPHLERLLGPWRYASVYLLSALGGSVAVYAFGQPYTSTVGASGAIFGLFAACLLFVRDLGFDRRSLIATIVINFVFTFSVPGISQFSHVGGFIAGGVCCFALAGLPWRRRRLDVRIQASGLVLILALLVGVVAWRTAVLS